MPIAIPPPDIDPVVMPRSSAEFSEAETRETGVATAEPVTTAKPGRDEHAEGLLKLWRDSRAR